MLLNKTRIPGISTGFAVNRTESQKTLSKILFIRNVNFFKRKPEAYETFGHYFLMRLGLSSQISRNTNFKWFLKKIAGILVILLDE